MRNGMSVNNIDSTPIDNKDSNRRKRIKRLKATIVVVVILLILLPTIGCIILGIQVSRLQKQMKDLVSLHSQYGLVYEETEDGHYAYAAEIPVADFDNSLTDTSKTEDALDTELDNFNHNKEENALISSEDLDEVEDNKKENKKDDKATEVTEATGTKNSSKGIYAGKKVYLTFDDGPSMYTDDILDILAEYDVKATFFVVGETDKAAKELYKRIVDEGHTLGMHSYTHKYDKIYNSVEDFDKDFTKLWKLLYDTTGYKSSIYRFPGGSNNLVNKNGMEGFIKYLNDASVVYFDWNVVNGDATSVKYTKEQLIDNVLNGVAIKGTSVVLMHDSQTKEATVASLPELLEELISEGAQILPLDNDIPPIQMIKSDSIK